MAKITEHMLDILMKMLAGRQAEERRPQSLSMRKRLKSTAQDERAVAEEGSRAGQRCRLLSHAERRKENEANICENLSIILVQFVPFSEKQR